ncbi:hypothetical protein LWI28_021819 [Acer negundo]|uniref:Peptidase A2 domain-containing protein n=1 Tax=Acer negundo TaxID=4023 RepID=A0AAD5NFZ2_ACENE|nr:hypothetical protein LWI28_021819 [Acer negundo]
MSAEYYAEKIGFQLATDAEKCFKTSKRMEVSIFYNNLLDSMEAEGNLDFYFDRLEHPIDGDYDDGEEFKYDVVESNASVDLQLVNNQTLLATFFDQILDGSYPYKFARLMWVVMEINGEILTTLLDTGSSRNLLAKAVVDLLGIQPQPYSSMIQGVNG